ncbi:heterokaryon incompatibility, partial [Immersiella caudata]
YAALSYVWGPSTPEAYIEVNTQPVRVTRNLEVALRHLRNAPDNNENKLRFWIDAVCIDQSSTRERSTEVARMGRIYSSARRVVCWLGPAFAGVDVALGTVRDLERVAGSEVEFLSPWNSSAQKRVVTGEAIRGLYEMLRRPYWSRLWIVQEVAL